MRSQEAEELDEALIEELEKMAEEGGKIGRIAQAWLDIENKK